MTGFLFDTLVWTAALIALVLVLRRPVARHFGPQAAYALWLLPFVRLVMPPIELPAWLAPVETAAQGAADSEIATYTFVMTGDVAALAPAAEAAPGSSFEWGAVLLALWFGGAAIFLARRFRLYFRMRSELLADATPVGEAGRVRLVETPAATSPVAFGVLDKVVALPPGFMASFDRRARDLAIEHELAHHRGHDLLANFAAQPLFALHWFNPLAWVGWRAMRRDQEAACDARVVATRARAERATYAEIIAGFAAGPNIAPSIALAAPMACPVLGEKSIIHRLRSLNMSDISPRRRFAGRALIAAGVLALPLTASITYAESLTAPEAPAAPEAPVVAAAPPAPPAPPSAVTAPTPPTPPAPPTALMLQAAAEAEAAADERDVRVIRIVRDEESDGEGKRTKKVERRIITSDGRKLTEEERAEILAELDEGLAEMNEAMEEAHREHKRAMIEMENARGELTRISVKCDSDGKRNRWTDDEGRQHVMLCTSEIMAQALDGLKEARAAIARNREMDAEIRKSVIEALDQQIARWKDRN